MASCFWNSPDWEYLGLCQPYGFCQNDSTLSLWYASNYRHFVNEWILSYANKALFIKNWCSVFGSQGIFSDPCYISYTCFFPIILLPLFYITQWLGSIHSCITYRGYAQCCAFTVFILNICWMNKLMKYWSPVLLVHKFPSKPGEFFISFSNHRKIVSFSLCLWVFWSLTGDSLSYLPSLWKPLQIL